MAREVAAEATRETLHRKQQQKLFGRVRLGLSLFLAIVCLAPAVAMEPPSKGTQQDGVLVQAKAWLSKTQALASQQAQRIPPPVQDALAGSAMFAAVLLPQVPLLKAPIRRPPPVAPKPPATSIPTTPRTLMMDITRCPTRST